MLRTSEVGFGSIDSNGKKSSDRLREEEGLWKNTAK